MLALPYAAALPLCKCWRVSRSWPAAAHLRSAAASARLFRFAPHAPLQSRLPWSARERACSGGAGRTFSVFGAAGIGHSGVTHGAVGSLHLIIGPMFAGKTTALLQMVQEHEGSGKKVVVVKSDRDGRYSTREVVSHDGLRRQCLALPLLASLHERLTTAEFEAVDVIAVDEAQFFPDLKEFCIAAADTHHKAVIVAGLDGDFRREAFGHILSLVPHADVVTKKVGRCQRCQRPSLFSLRTVADTRTELVGGSEAYLPACRTCYNSLHATRSSDAAQPQVAR